MRNRINTLLLTGAAVLAASLAAAPAQAATRTWTVTPGGTVTGSAGTTSLKDTASGTVLSCASSALSGTVKSGSGLAGHGLGSLTSWSFSHCTGPLGLAFTVSGSFPWQISAASYNAASGTTTGTITGIHLVLSGNGCSAVVDGTGPAAFNGSEKFKYINGTGKLKLLPATSTMHFYNVSGCFGLVAGRDAATLAGTITISPRQAITSP